MSDEVPRETIVVESTGEDPMLRGVVDRVVADDKFGFIIGPNGEEYFFHQTDLNGPSYDELAPGVPVEFDVAKGTGDRPDEHLRAVNIHFAPDAVPAVDNELLPAEKVAPPDL
ncbi:MAG TPA: cold shock domain-containing protein [Thermomicrobiales bacterium]|jgi:cold shock CspA family protein|nr:cold shock domain-containing protein [Thermomicrobiales bacterium]